jgi:hypothetical protein
LRRLRISTTSETLPREAVGNSESRLTGPIRQHYVEQRGLTFSSVG